MFCAVTIFLHFKIWLQDVFEIPFHVISNTGISHSAGLLIAEILIGDYS